MAGSKVVAAHDAVARIADGAVVTVSSSSGLGCPDAVLAALGARFAEEGHPRGLTMLQVAVGGLAALPAVGSVIAGATSVEQVQQNVAAAAWVPSDDDLATLRVLTGGDQTP